MDNEEQVEKLDVIGKIVKVTVDRPMGSYHPNHRDIYYPVNYGYIKGIMSPDGEEQDAYILGIDHPVDEFTGRVIAVIHRYDDIEEKWVVAPVGKTYSAEEIKAQVDFQEQYFNYEESTYDHIIIGSLRFSPYMHRHMYGRKRIYGRCD